MPDPAERLLEATSRLAAAYDPAIVVDTIVDCAVELFEASAVVVYAFDPTSGELRVQGSRGVPGLAKQRPQLVLDDSLPLARAIERCEPVWLPSLADAIAQFPALANTAFPHEHLAAVAALPLSRGPLLGGLALSWSTPRAFDASERDSLVRFGAEVAVAIERGRIFASEHRACAEARRHSDDSARLVASLGETLRMNELFTGVLAHDLRNPLGAISTAGQLLLLRADQRACEADQKPARRILASADRMARMIDQLLDFTRVRLGSGLPLEPRPADVRSVVTSVVDEVAATRCDRQITVDIVGDPAGTWDDDRLAQVFSNLIANAADHGAAGPIAVRIDGTAPDQVIATIHNEGVIPPALVSNLFQPLVGGVRRRDGSRGLGLGLFITHEIARRHGGAISVISDDDRGTTFTLTLPRHTVKPEASPDPAQLPAPISRERFLIDTIRDYAIFSLDTEGRVQSWNRGAELAKGYRAEEIIGRHISVFYTPADRARNAPQQMLQRALAQGHAEDEAWRVRKDGSHFWANVVLTALRDENGVHTGFAKVTRDLTERKKLEEERLRLAEANEGIRLRDEFLSIVSHELKTPLTGLQLQLQLLAETASTSDPRIAQKLERAEVSCDRITQLIESLLDVSRIATGRFVVTPELVDLSAIVADTVATFRPAAQRSGTPLEVVTPGPVVGMWDRVRLVQVVTNLLSNALKYGVGKPIDVVVETTEREATLVVRDRGPGIALEDRERIFGRFERASSARHFGGLGIGLYMVREIASAHGGTVTATTAPDGGAILALRLPRELGETAPEVRAPSSD